jgi:ubiquinone/menaquinone biosynthesis C-methylase UbiE
MLAVAACATNPLARTFLRADAHTLPFSAASLHVLTSFNCIHLLDTPAMLAEAARVLVSGGRLFIYTRWHDQNRQTIWGRYFPGFAERESRLTSAADLGRAVETTPDLELISEESFTFRRCSTRAELLELAHARHYSTFALYSAAEFDSAVSEFARRISRLTDPIVHQASNTLVTIQRT